MWDEFGAAQIYHEQTLAYVRYKLGIDPTPPQLTNRIILNFAPAGDACKIPSIDEFWHYRLRNSAVTVFLAPNEYSWENMRLPTGFHADKDVKSSIEYVNTIISATNDLLSLKKEVQRDAIDSLIPIIFHHMGDIQLAVDEVVAFRAAEVVNLDTAAASSFERYEAEDKGIRRQVKNFVDGCKHYVTRNLT
ncbi:hypothetical protein P154DRAFT_549883 [Amniculicola lignicola CBS 123094]|uniref:Terpenoid synthase n=1 Tax=Amniculicola lignicola CBS 123094 TaxID=1392246 RepID=A0A6A5VSP6_9PLEO|nr:hypothetical protein P154DRAFT_549883 [Amniculicola lignicola CBS 123094]